MKLLIQHELSAFIAAWRPFATAGRSILAGVTTAITLLASAAHAAAEPSACNDPSCTPGITGGVVLGAPCSDTTHFVFGTTSWGRLVFCGSPRRYDPRYFRAPSMRGIKDENSNCEGFENSVAQAPDGLFLTCVSVNGEPRWVRGDT
ncbi:hypothetical protein ACK280_16150 [Mycobacterium sherrisii]|uniref:hypothetical protein n=1 Tax=Mycobacterium sherrisii TaxID=243061 RepID=UPI0039754823